MKIIKIASGSETERDIKHLRSDLNDLSQEVKKLAKKVETDFKKLEDGLEKQILAVIRAERTKKVRTMQEWREMGK